MDTTELGRALRDATAELEPRPGFTAAVIRGGQRRKFRARSMIATGMAAATAAVAGTGAYLIWLDQPTSVEAATDPRLTQPTKGDLRGDRAFLNAAVTAWREGLSRWNPADLRGRPHVYWAGTTPAGRTAVIYQGFFQSDGELHREDPDRMAMLVGLVAIDPADGKLKVVSEEVELFPGPTSTRGHFQFGPGDRTILVVEREAPLWLSSAPTTGQDGQVTRDWQQLPVVDGVAIAQLPDGARAGEARVMVRAARPAPDDKDRTGWLLLEPASRYVALAKAGWPTFRQSPPASEARLKWLDESALRMRVGGPAWPIPEGEGEPMGTFLDGLNQAGMTDFDNYQGSGAWSVIAGLADGRTALVSEYVEDETPSRIYALLLNRDGSVNGAVRGDGVDPAAPLPVRLRLPDGQGWVVADYGATLRYQVGAGAPWQSAGQNAALVPDAATAVEVTRNGTATVIPLSR